MTIELAVGLLRRQFNRTDLTVVVHNKPYDLSMLWHEDLHPRCQMHCSKNLAWLCGKSVRHRQSMSTGLKPLVKAHYDYQMVSFQQVSFGRPFDTIDPAVCYEYACDDARWALRMYKDWYHD